jgi:hypothetical protein
VHVSKNGILIVVFVIVQPSARSIFVISCGHISSYEALDILGKALVYVFEYERQ